VLVAALGVLEAGYSGNSRVEQMPTALPALDAPIVRDHTGSLVVDVPYGLRGGIPESGGRFAPEALVLATADGHPRAVAYVSRIPRHTLLAVGRHSFYTYLIHVQHYTSPPQGPPLSPQALATRTVPLWSRRPASYAPVTKTEIAAARRDARRLHIGWVLVWYENPAILGYLSQTGFRFSYQADGVLVYRPYVSHQPLGSGPP
jgi:hypothetical protein